MNVPGSVRPNGYSCGERILLRSRTCVSGTFVRRLWHGGVVSRIDQHQRQERRCGCPWFPPFGKLRAGSFAEDAKDGAPSSEAGASERPLGLQRPLRGAEAPLFHGRVGLAVCLKAYPDTNLPKPNVSAVSGNPHFSQRTREMGQPAFTARRPGASTRPGISQRWLPRYE